MHRPQEIDPYLLFAVLNTPIVKRQIRAKQFTQNIIDTLGGRIAEIVLPIPKDPAVRADISTQTQRIVETRSRLRQEAKQVVLALEDGLDEFGEDVDFMS